jgi:hypothetical protein
MVSLPNEFAEEVRSLPAADYRSRPELTLARAASYDSDVKTWTITGNCSMKHGGRRYEAQVNAGDAEELNDPALVPMRC